MDQTFWVHPSAIVDQPAHIGAGTKIWHFAHVMAGARIGAGCSLGQGVFVGAGAVVGDGCKIQNNVSVYDAVVLEDEVFVGPSAVFTNVVTPRAFVSRKHLYAETRVERGASIGANATIVCGTRIGRFALIGAGAVVTREVPAYGLMLGVPARLAGWVCRCGERLGDVAGPGIACAICGDRYVLEASAAGPRLAPKPGP